MARAKRLNSEKVTISIDSDILLNAKHKALDSRLTLSDYIQGLVSKDLGKKPVKVVAVPSDQELGTDIFANYDSEKIDIPQISLPLDEIDEKILELKESGLSFQKIADQLNNEGLKSPTGGEFNKNYIDRRYKKLKK